MSRIHAISDLQRIKGEYLEQAKKYEKTVLVCGGGSCEASGCQKVKETIGRFIEGNNLSSKINVIATGCIGLCSQGPTVLVMPSETFYVHMTPEKAIEVAQAELMENKTLEQYTYYDKAAGCHIPRMGDIPFFAAQVKNTLHNCGQMDYTSLDAYIARDGYFALANVLSKNDPASVIAEIKASGLRGRGGAAFPTWIKWEAMSKQPGPDKYVLCNADEGNPGAYMDRALLEGDPHSIIEGMMIAAFTTGAKEGFIYVRVEYPMAAERLTAALEQAREAGLLGQNILGSGFNFSLDIRVGAGAFVCGEETALMASVEGSRGEPLQKPPFPFECGVFGKPSNLNNVETYANVPQIILKGGNWFASWGTEKSKGTKLFSLAGAIENTGIVEVPMGMSLREMIFNIGGGIPSGKYLKTVQLGGPAGGFVKASQLDTKLDYESVAEAGVSLGSGGIIAMDNDISMVDAALFYMDFMRHESCGKCYPCRLGTKRMVDILQKISDGNGTEEDLVVLREIAATMKDAALCGLGQEAAAPVVSAMNTFPEEFEEKIGQCGCCS